MYALGNQISRFRTCLYDHRPCNLQYLTCLLQLSMTRLLSLVILMGTNQAFFLYLRKNSFNFV